MSSEKIINAFKKLGLPCKSYIIKMRESNDVIKFLKKMKKWEKRATNSKVEFKE